MISTLIRIYWLNLKRDGVALALTFVLPVIFFSIFAAIFGGMSGSGEGTRPTRVVLVDEDNSEFSANYAAALEKEAALKIYRKAQDENGEGKLYTDEDARRLVREGKVEVGVVLPVGFGEFGVSMGGAQANQSAVTLYHDPSNPVARHAVNGLLQAAAMSAAPTLMMDAGMDTFIQFGGPLTDQQKEALQLGRSMQQGNEDGGNNALIKVEVVDAVGSADEGDDGPNMVANYAAGIGVMFLLFSLSGAGGSLLEEEENGTMERLLTSNVGIGKILTGKWLFFSALGISQLVVMFLWAALVFGLDLFTPKHLAGFVLMTIPCGMGAAAFGILLATVAKTRAQLNGMSTIIILIMSALGGSMVPRFAMPAFMDTTAKFTFNGWAIDGYLKIFWREDPNHTLVESLVYILPEVGVVCAMTVGFMFIARRLASRWEMM